MSSSTLKASPWGVPPPLPQRGARSREMRQDRRFEDEHAKWAHDIKASRDRRQPGTNIWMDHAGRRIYGPAAPPWAARIFDPVRQAAFRKANAAGFVAAREIGERVFGRDANKANFWRNVVRQASRKPDMEAHWHCIVRFPSPQGMQTGLQYDPRFRNVVQSCVFFDPERGVQMMQHAINQPWWASFFDTCVERWRLEGASTQYDRRRGRKSKYWTHARAKDWRVGNE